MKREINPTIDYGRTPREYVLGGLTVSAAEASPFHHGHDYEVQQLAHKHHSYHPKKYSEGDRNTAAIAGAIVGAVIAKNT